MQGDFESRLELGRLGERLVVEFLKSRRSGVVPSYDYTGSDGNKAPRLQFATFGLIVPDLDVCREGTRQWLEVKTYAGPAWNRRRKTLVHAIPARLFADYVAVEKQSGSPVWIAVLELSSGELLVVRLAALDEPQSWGCECRACSGQEIGSCFAPMKRGRYWRRDAMKLLHTFTDAELQPLRSRSKPAA
ncbi:MAG: hypothetical protein ACK4N5_18305 [Myxococcales bacterium]